MTTSISDDLHQSVAPDRSVDAWAAPVSWTLEPTAGLGTTPGQGPTRGTSERVVAVAAGGRAPEKRVSVAALHPAKSDVAGGCRGYKALVDDGSRPPP